MKHDHKEILSFIKDCRERPLTSEGIRYLPYFHNVLIGIGNNKAAGIFKGTTRRIDDFLLEIDTEPLLKKIFDV